LPGAILCLEMQLDLNNTYIAHHFQETVISLSLGRTFLRGIMDSSMKTRIQKMHAQTIE